MRYADSFKVSSLPPDREIQVTRDFHAPRQTVCLTPSPTRTSEALVAGPPGWTMPVCESIEGCGAYRYVWRKDGAKGYGMGGIFREIESPKRSLPPRNLRVLVPWAMP